MHDKLHLHYNFVVLLREIIRNTWVKTLKYFLTL